jgi:hypothetical protein
VAHLEVGEEWFEELSAVGGHLEHVVGNPSEEEKCPA